MKLVTAAIIEKNGQILIARRGPNDKWAGKWEFPGGKVEIGETLQQCLVREIKEELGISIEVGELFGESIYSYDTGSIKLISFWSTWTEGQIDPSDHDLIKWVCRTELAQFDFLPADIPFVRKLENG